MEERYSLTWEDFQTNVQSTFEKVRQSNDFSDVTLVGEDYQVEAHRLVLSAGSQFFQHVLKRLNNPHALIYLKGTKRGEMETILSFLYLGEVTICRENLEQFLLTARDLQVRGVMEDEPKTVSAAPKSPTDIHESLYKENGKLMNTKITLNPKTAQEEKEPGKKSLIRSHFSKSTEGDQANCNLCGKQIATKNGNTSGLWRHMENKHQGVPVNLFDNSSPEEEELDFRLNQSDSKLWNHGNLTASQDKGGAADDETRENDQEPESADALNGSEWEHRTGRSRVWEHFKRLSQDKAMCRTCDR